MSCVRTLLTDIHIYLSRAVLVEDLEGLLEARGLQQELEVLFAAVSEELDHFIVGFHGVYDLSSRQRAAAVLVDELEALPSRVQEISGEFRNLALRRKGVELALCGSLGKLVFERDLDTFLPLIDIDVPVAIRVHLGKGLVEARRDQQVLQVFVAAVDEKFYHFLVALDSLDAAGGSGGKRRVTSMAYEPPLTLRTAGAAADLTPSP